jgi:hypothetical protein
MSLSITNIESAALKLPRSERAKVALHLLNSLQEEQTKLSPEAIELAWIDESVSWRKAYHGGEMKAYSAEEIINELEKIRRQM